MSLKIKKTISSRHSLVPLNIIQQKWRCTIANKAYFKEYLAKVKRQREEKTKCGYRLTGTHRHLTNPTMPNCRHLLSPPANTLCRPVKFSHPPLRSHFSGTVTAVSDSVMAANSVRVAAAQMTSINDLASNFATCVRLAKVTQTSYFISLFVLLEEDLWIPKKKRKGNLVLEVSEFVQEFCNYGCQLVKLDCFFALPFLETPCACW